jgi:hypothetical protein
MGSVRAVNTIRWMMSSIGYADQFQVRVATSYGSWSNLGTFGNPTATNTWFGIELASARSARFVQLAFTNPNGDPALGAVGEIEIWGGTPAAAARANPLFAGSALEIEHTEVNGGEIVGDGGTSVSIAADRPETVTTVLETTTNNGLTGVRWMSGAGIAVTVSTSADSSTWTRVASVITVDSGSAWQGVILQSAADTRFVRIEARPGSSTSAPHLNDVEIWGMEIDVATAEASPDAVTPIASEEAPDATPLQPTAEPTHEIPATDDPTEQPATPVATNAPTETPTEEPTATDEPTEIPTDVPTEEPTVAPTEAPPTQPLTIVDTGDTENSGTAWNAQDDDPSTVWTVYPSAETSQVRLYVDLGSVQPIGGLSFTLRTWDQLPAFEIWLSEDAVTWFNVTPGGINGWNLPRDEAITLDLGYNARYVRIVVPNVHQTGLGQIGGIDDLQVWPGESTQTARLTNAFAPTTPIPVTIPTEEVLPTGEPTVEEAIPTEEPVIEEPTEEVIPTEEPTVEVIAEPTDVPTEVVVGEPTEDLPAEEIPPADEPTEEAVG